MESLTIEASNLTEARVETQKQALEIIAGMLDIQSMDWERQEPALKRQVQRTNFLEIGVVSPDRTQGDGPIVQTPQKIYNRAEVILWQEKQEKEVVVEFIM